MKPKVFFQDIGCLDEYNFGLTTSLALTNQLSITIGASTLHTFFEAQKLSHSIKNLNCLLMLPPVFRRAQNLAVSAIPQLYTRFLKKFDLLHLNDLSSPYSKMALINVAKPIILTIHDSTRYVSSQNRTSAETSELISLLSLVNKVVVPSKYFSNVVQQRTGFNPVIINHGVNTNIFNVSISQEQARKSLGIPRNRKVILWNSRISPLKDPKTLFDAIPGIVRKEPSALFLVIGRAPPDEQETGYMKSMLSYAGKKIKAAGITGNVRFLTKQYIPHNKLPMYYRSADVFVHTSLAESFGIVTIEAMACKLPIVAANSSCLPEIVGNGGLLFEPGDSSELSEKVVKVLTDEALSIKLGKGALQRVHQKFTWSKAAGRYTSLYQSIA